MAIDICFNSEEVYQDPTYYDYIGMAVASITIAIAVVGMVPLLYVYIFTKPNSTKKGRSDPVVYTNRDYFGVKRPTVVAMFQSAMIMFLVATCISVRTTEVFSQIQDAVPSLISYFLIIIPLSVIYSTVCSYAFMIRYGIIMSRVEDKMLLSDNTVNIGFDQTREVELDAIANPVDCSRSPESIQRMSHSEIAVDSVIQNTLVNGEGYHYSPQEDHVLQGSCNFMGKLYTNTNVLVHVDHQQDNETIRTIVRNATPIWGVMLLQIVVFRILLLIKKYTGSKDSRQAEVDTFKRHHIYHKRRLWLIDDVSFLIVTITAIYVVPLMLALVVCVTSLIKGAIVYDDNAMVYSGNTYLVAFISIVAIAGSTFLFFLWLYFRVNEYYSTLAKECLLYTELFSMLVLTMILFALPGVSSYSFIRMVYLVVVSALCFVMSYKMLYVIIVQWFAKAPDYLYHTLAILEAVSSDKHHRGTDVVSMMIDAVFCSRNMVRSMRTRVLDKINTIIDNSQGDVALFHYHSPNFVLGKQNLPRDDVKQSTLQEDDLITDGARLYNFRDCFTGHNIALAARTLLSIMVSVKNNNKQYLRIGVGDITSYINILINIFPQKLLMIDDNYAYGVKETIDDKEGPTDELSVLQETQESVNYGDVIEAMLKYTTGETGAHSVTRRLLVQMYSPDYKSATVQKELAFISTLGSNTNMLSESVIHKYCKLFKVDVTWYLYAFHRAYITALYLLYKFDDSHIHAAIYWYNKDKTSSQRQSYLHYEPLVALVRMLIETKFMFDLCNEHILAARRGGFRSAIINGAINNLVDSPDGKDAGTGSSSLDDMQPDQSSLNYTEFGQRTDTIRTKLQNYDYVDTNTIALDIAHIFKACMLALISIQNTDANSMTCNMNKKQLVGILKKLHLDDNMTYASM